MKCERVREISADALDGLLSAEDADAFHGHLAHCRACVLFYERLREAVALLEELPEVEVGPDFNERVWARLAAEPTSGPGLAGTLRALGERVVAWRERLTPAAPAGRWSLAGVAAAVVAMLAISAEPPLPFFAERADEDETTVATSAGRDGGTDFALAPSAPASFAGRSSREVLHDRAARMAARSDASARTQEEEEEVTAEMPVAVEAFLRNARDLRLTNGDDRYRRANYTYPLRRFPEVSPLLMVGEEAPVPIVGARPTADREAAVIAF